jgi:hypothetical protein
MFRIFYTHAWISKLGDTNEIFRMANKRDTFDGYVDKLHGQPSVLLLYQ